MALFGSSRLEREDELKLKFVQIVVRHGIRGPLMNFPSNIYDDDYWEQYGGLAQLTPHGMNQMYDFGVYLRNLYSSFLTPYYHPANIKVRSSNSHRAIQSASALLAGLYQPTEAQKWKGGWLPIPIINCDLEFDQIFCAEGCTRYENMKSDAFKSEIFNKTQKENLNFLQNLGVLSDINPFGLDKVLVIADNYLAANAMNLNLPLWVLEHKKKVLELHYLNKDLAIGNKEMAKLVGGSLLNDMIMNIDKVLEKEKNWEIYLYSSHDNYIVALLKLLNLNPIKPPNFAAGLFFEVYESIVTREHYIKFYYKNNNANNNITRSVLKIDGCENPCPLKTFYFLTADKKVNNASEFCKDT